MPRGTQARVLVRVACNSTVHWSLNVPVDIHHATDVLVLRRAVGRGEIIRAEDVLVQSRELAGPHLTVRVPDPRISAAA